jgi:uncharacterized protein YhfF
MDLSGKVVHEWSFGDDKILADKLKQLVLSGAKTATTGLWYEGKNIPSVGDNEAILDTNGKRFCIIQVVGVQVRPFLEVDWEFIQREGEGDANVDSWRKNHRNVFRRWSDSFSDQSLVVCEEFKVIKILDL